MSTHLKNEKAFSVNEGCKKNVTVISTTIMFHFKLDFFLLINFQQINTAMKNKAISSGIKQAINDFMMYWELEKKLTLKSFKKQSNESTTSELYPINYAGVKIDLIN